MNRSPTASSPRQLRRFFDRAGEEPAPAGSRTTLGRDQAHDPFTGRGSTAAGAFDVPDFFLAALKKNKEAQMTFESFSYSHKKEYLEWITEAKGEDTRNKRLETALEWMSDGKPRNWKYRKC